jgi:hypothetical protein
LPVAEAPAIGRLWVAASLRRDNEVRHRWLFVVDAFIGKQAVAGLDMSSDLDPTKAVSFPGSLGTAVGDVVRAVPVNAKQPRTAAWWVRGACDVYDVLAVGGKAGVIDGISSGAPRMASAEGTWRLEKRRRFGWEYVLVDSDGQDAGWYAGRRWLPGGRISLNDGTQADLRRSFRPPWKLQTTATHERCVDISKARGRTGSTLTLTIRALPRPAVDLHVLMLTACAVILLEDTVPGVRSADSFATG